MKKTAREPAARIVEVFSSLQGEGLRVGERQIFVRFGGCNLRCDYCDEPGALDLLSGSTWTLGKLGRELDRRLAARPHKSVSWTGGEPLLQARFLESAMRLSRKKGLGNYLETNGSMPEALRPLAPLCDVVAVDLKLPSATGRELWSDHLAFLRVAPDRTFVKVVLTDASTEREWRQTIRLLQEAGPQIPLILQPATSFPPDAPAVRSPPPERAVAFLRQARGLLKDVRLAPQWHPLWKLP